MNLFYVTSFITERVSKRIIEVEELDSFRIISDKRYNPKHKSYIKEGEIYDIKKPLKLNLINNWGEIIEGNRKISEISKGSFHLYVPNTNIEFVKMALSHKNCEGFSFVEEGFTSYCEFGSIGPLRQKAKRRVKNYISYMGNIEKPRIFKDGYEKAYGTNEHSFPKWERKKIINPKISESLESKVVGGESCILVIDSMRNLNNLKERVYISSLSRVVGLLEKRYKKIYYKMHPDNYLNGNDEIFKSIVEVCDVCTKEIEQNYSIEEMSVGSKSDVIVNLSSAGMYCLLFSESKVYTFYDMFRNQAKMAGLEAENILGFEKFVPDVFWDNVLPLQESG